MSKLARCPECGGEVAFSHPASILSVCSFCQSVIARTDVALEKLGKVALLAEVPSPLQLGLRGGAYGGFAVVGQLQLSYGAGTWNEWYLGLDNGKWLWLAEAQGRYYLTAPLGPVQTAPAFDRARPGHTVRLPGPADSRGPGDEVVMRVAEVHTAQITAAKGELPFRIAPGEEVRYIDLSGPKRTFGTLDYGPPSSTEVQGFAGRELDLAELQLDLSSAPAVQRPTLRAARMSCPSCQGALSLRAPDATQRVTCPYCRALVDVTGEPLLALGTLKKGKEPRIALGRTATLRGTNYTVLGHLCRGIVGSGFTWDEYVLSEGADGFHYLIESGGHFTLVRPASLGDVRGKGDHRTYLGELFRSAERSRVRVLEVQGEFPWAVEVGEEVLAEDFADPEQGRLLSLETGTGPHKEMVASLGDYVPAPEAERAFGLTSTPAAPSFIAPHQPNPYAARLCRQRPIFLVCTCAIALLMMFFHMRARGQQTSRTFQLSTVAGVEPAAEHIFLSEPFTLGTSGQAALSYDLLTDVRNSWVATDAALINDEDGTVFSFGAEAAYYFGFEDGDSWSEGSQTASVTLPEVPAGRYVLRVEPSWPVTSAAVPYRVTLRYPASRTGYGLLVILLLSLVPLWTWIRRGSFEARRQADQKE